jgi:hypothetical protein
MLAADVVAIIFLLFTYHPDPHKLSGHIGIGGIVLDCSLWSILFGITGSLSLLNIYENVRKFLIISLLSFFIGPLLLLVIMYLLPVKAEDLFGFATTGWTFLILQLFLFTRFRYFIRHVGHAPPL